MHFQDGPEPIDRRTLLTRGGAALAALLVTGCSRNGRPEFSVDGLERLRSGLQRHIAQSFAPGVVGLVAHGEIADSFVLGKTAFAGGRDMRRDSIFRIASMTKAITAAAVMMLVEEGKLTLDEPVDRLLPELANRRVLRSIDANVDDTVPAKRPITIEDLLTFRCGLGMVVAPPNRYPIQKAIAALGVNGVGFGPPDPAMPLDGDAWMRKIGTLPLFAQPGEEWLYTAGSNIQGVLVARASGRPLSRFFDERIFGPLGMKDTAFFVMTAKIDRLVHAYRPQIGALVVSDEPATGKWSRPPTFEQGDAGLVSTADDYLAFVRMVLANGRYRGQTLLTPASVNAMTTNHLTAPQRAGGKEILGGRGWGYGMSVVTDTVSGRPTPGSFGWIGGFGSSWVSDPSKDLTMILLTQREFVSASGDPIHQEFQSNAYRALR
ncbi:MAG TPA: serine hydrolase domain-containing protein [Vicinamibacterales bacterium]|nr:serine hydrolase domain-containing protein [Vicinamibacterales bacterium]